MKVLIASDGSDASTAAEKFIADNFCSKSTAIEIVTVVDEQALTSHWMGKTDATASLVASEKTHADSLLEKEAASFAQAGFQVEVTKKIGHPSGEVLSRSTEANADLIVVGAHRKSRIAQFLLGSESSRVVRHADRSVLVHRHNPEGSSNDQPMRILFAYDGSASADRALDLLKSKPFSRPVSVLLVHVLELVEVFNMDAVQHNTLEWEAEVQRTKTELETLKSDLEAVCESVDLQLHQSGRIDEEILQTSDVWKPDLILMGHQGRNPVPQFLLGSVAHRVCDHAPCSVLIAR